MNIIKIYLRVQLKTKTLRLHIRNQLSKITNLQYISIQTKFMFKGKTFPTYTIGRKCYLDLKNSRDIKLYLKYITNLYNVKKTNKGICRSVTGIYLQYAASTRKDYLNFIKSIKQENPIKSTIRIVKL